MNHGDLPIIVLPLHHTFHGYIFSIKECIFSRRHRAPVATGTGARAAPVQAMTVTAVFFAQRWEENKSRIHGFIVFIYVVLFVIFIVWCFFFLCLA